MAQVMIRCGKHAGRPFGDVAATDPWYCAWVLREKADGTKLSRDLGSFAKYIQDVHGGVLEVGKHRGMGHADGRISQRRPTTVLATALAHMY